MAATPRKTYPDTTVQEEIVNIITHSLGIIAGIIALVFLVSRGLDSGNWLYLTAVSIYGVTFTWTYITSTLYHSLYKAKVKVRNTFHLLDHTAIYLFIAGTYTPVALFALPEGWNTGILAAIWILAVAGIIFKFISIGRLERLSTIFYLLMGWLIVIAARPLIDNAPIELLYWILAGGLCYSVGSLFFMMPKIKYNHGIWHILVLAGSICHFAAIYFYLGY